MEKNEVSIHEVRILRSLRGQKGWLTSKDVAEQAEVAPRTARAHLLKLVRLGIVDQAEVFPGHRYKLSEFADKRNRTYMDRINRAEEVFGLA